MRVGARWLCSFGHRIASVWFNSPPSRLHDVTDRRHGTHILSNDLNHLHRARFHNDVIAFQHQPDTLFGPSIHAR